MFRYMIKDQTNAERHYELLTTSCGYEIAVEIPRGFTREDIQEILHGLRCALNSLSAITKPIQIDEVHGKFLSLVDIRNPATGVTVKDNDSEEKILEALGLETATIAAGRNKPFKVIRRARHNNKMEKVVLFFKDRGEVEKYLKENFLLDIKECGEGDFTYIRFASESGYTIWKDDFVFSVRWTNRF